MEKWGKNPHNNYVYANPLTEKNSALSVRVKPCVNSSWRVHRIIPDTDVSLPPYGCSTTDMNRTIQLLEGFLNTDNNLFCEYKTILCELKVESVLGHIATTISKVQHQADS